LDIKRTHINQKIKKIEIPTSQCQTTVHDLNDHELISVVIGAEALLNSRPLTHSSDDPNDKDGYLITPNHFLMGQAGGQFAPNVGEQIQRVPKARWLYLQRLIAHFWKLWMSYLVPALQSRPKWRNESENLKEGQLVVLLEQKSPRGLGLWVASSKPGLAKTEESVLLT
jgi:hypothetical protein